VANEYIDYGTDLERVGNYGKAAKVYALAAKRAENDDTAGYAMLCRADCMYAARKHFKAVDYYKEAVSKYPQQIDYAHALTMFRTIAEDFANGRTRGLFKGFRKRDARELYRYLISLAPYGEKTGADMIRLAELQRNAREIPEAIATYKLAMKRFPGTDVANEARVELAETLLNEAQETRDTYRLAEATDAHVRRALRADPGNEEALEIQAAVNKLYADHYYYLGNFYQNPFHYRPEPAQRYLETVFKAYPTSENADSASQQWAVLAGEDTPDVPAEPEQIRETRELPDPEEVVPGLIIGDDLPPEKEPTPADRQEDERIRKWLLPIDDLGI
jgi:tetratricopeptide (TPR) repeat protein